MSNSQEKINKWKDDMTKTIQDLKTELRKEMELLKRNKV